MSLEERLKYAAMKARHKNIFRPWYQKWWGILILIILGLILIILVASGIYVVNKIKQIRAVNSQTSLEQQRQNYINTINGDGTNFTLGTNKPQVTIVEFGDFACPFCQESATGTRKLLADYKDKVKLIFRDYPLHDNSIDLASAARCAGEQGKFWEIYDEFYANQDKFTAVSGDALTAQLMSLAAFLKLNTSQFSDCLTSKKYIDQIRKDYEDGENLQISGTPTWFINNYALTGYVPAAKFQELVTGLMKK